MRCRSKISMEDVFTGYVEKSREVLQESIDCCRSWKTIYNRISKVHSNCSSEAWLLDESSIFAQVINIYVHIPTVDVIFKSYIHVG